MTPSVWAFWIICGYLALLLALGFWASRRFTGGNRDYVMASHSIGPFLLLMSLFGTTMTAFALVGSTGEAYREGIGVYGMMASSSGIIHSLCFFLVGIKVWTLGKRYGYTTQIAFFRDRLDNEAFGLLLFPILVGLVIPYLLIGVISAGLVIQAMTGVPGHPELGAAPFLGAANGGIPRNLAAAVICLVVLAYVFFGGMRGTAWANAFQTSVFMVLGVVTFYVIAMKLGQGESFLESLQNVSREVPHDKASRSHMSQTKFLTYMLIPFSVGMFPHLFQHWLTAKRASTFKLSVVLHPIFIMLVWVPCILVGIWATTGLVKLPPPIANDANKILPFLVKSQAGPILGGFLTAGILAAIMSSLDSQFLCLGTIFSNDIVGHYIGRDRFSDRQMVWIARGFIVAIVVVTYLFSLGESKSVFTLAIWCFSGFASLFPLVVAALYWRRLTAAGAYACVLVTIGLWGLLFYRSDFAANESYTVDFTLGRSHG